MRPPTAWIACSLLCLAIAIASSARSADRLTYRSSAAIKNISGNATPAPDNGILKYISSGWDLLTRDMNRCASLADPKLPAGTAPILYLPAESTLSAQLSSLAKNCAVDIEHLPITISDPAMAASVHLPREGLLYLEHPYVVPGGQFNEMYGWDSYFIIRGLLRDDRIDLAKGMVENFFFEIEHYGGVLNANRTYYLTRSQPPFLSSMILAVYDAEKDAGHPDLPWLAKAYKLAERDYAQWTMPPHLAGDTGLSRYFDRGSGPAPEVLNDPANYYRGVAQFFLLHEGTQGPHLFRPGAPAATQSSTLTFDNLCSRTPNSASTARCTTSAGLSTDYFEGDRAMRESGFDVSFRFGPYGADTHHFAPVCLNSLLYKTEKDLERMSTILGLPGDAQRWEQRASERQQRIIRYLWDEKKGMFFDYDFTKRARSNYDYATTFYPLWAGLASNAQAQAAVRNLKVFEDPGGLTMSRTKTGAQWDYPYGWAPIQLLAAEGLRRYGYVSESDRIAREFLGTVLVNFERDHSIREKYDVVTRSDDTHITAGYKQNVIGFGWTNGVFLELLNESSPRVAEILEKEKNQ